MNISSVFYKIILLALLSSLITACADEIAPSDDISNVEHLSLGNPSNAQNNSTLPDNYLMVKPQYALSYNRSRGTANWVSWHLSRSWLGNTERQDDFRSDRDLPSGWLRINGDSYRSSGFDRGHLCPSADRTASVADNSNTFLMTNIIPQAPDNNREAWADFETYTRGLILSGNMEAYVIAGVYGTGGTGSNGAANSISSGNVTVPSNVWKIVVLIPLGDNDAERVNTDTRVIAIDMPNIQGIANNSWRQYRCSIDDLERATGYDFLSEVDTEIQEVIEARVDDL